jgi:hypothetical protein
MTKTYRKVITNKYYAIRYWNALVNNGAVKKATMGKTEDRQAYLIQWWYA